MDAGVSVPTYPFRELSRPTARTPPCSSFLDHGRPSKTYRMGSGQEAADPPELPATTLVRQRDAVRVELSTACDYSGRSARRQTKAHLLEALFRKKSESHRGMRVRLAAGDGPEKGTVAFLLRDLFARTHCHAMLQGRHLCQTTTGVSRTDLLSSATGSICG